MSVGNQKSGFYCHPLTMSSSPRDDSYFFRGGGGGTGK